MIEVRVVPGRRERLRWERLLVLPVSVAGALGFWRMRANISGGGGITAEVLVAIGIVSYLLMMASTVPLYRNAAELQRKAKPFWSVQLQGSAVRIRNELTGTSERVKPGTNYAIAVLVFAEPGVELVWAYSPWGPTPTVNVDHLDLDRITVRHRPNGRVVSILFESEGRSSLMRVRKGRIPVATDLDLDWLN